MDTIDQSIKKTKDGFEKRFTERKFYNKQTHDDEHLKLILNTLTVTSGMKILDLGTGNGYVAFPLARNNPTAHVVGLDIVTLALQRNRRRALEENIANLEFISYDGKNFPFCNSEFDLIVCRYAVHHFPTICDHFKEISRVLKKNGKLFISDPTPIESDKEEFINDYMRLFDDGHIKYYTKSEFIDLASSAGLSFLENFETTLNFPKKRKNAKGFEVFMSKHGDKIKEEYKVRLTEDEIYMSQPVNNIMFQKL